MTKRRIQGLVAMVCMFVVFSVGLLISGHFVMTTLVNFIVWGANWGTVPAILVPICVFGGSPFATTIFLMNLAFIFITAGIDVFSLSTYKYKKGE